jgi:MerR family transcriptional regulator, light-induced transcriptional regulator
VTGGGGRVALIMATDEIRGTADPRAPIAFRPMGGHAGRSRARTGRCGVLRGVGSRVPQQSLSMTYRIKRVAHLTGINPATLRAWERRYGLVAPDRTVSGYRLYSDEDVAMLSRIKTLVDEGLTIGEAISRVRRGAVPFPADAAGLRVAEIRARLVEALVAYDRRRAVETYDEICALPVERRLAEVLLPVMHDVGDLWERGEAGICEEHFASGFVREKLMGIMEQLDTGSSRGPEAVCASVPGERHEFGLMAAALHLALRGWRLVYLGTEVPLDEIRRVLHARRPALFCTSLVNRLESAELHALLRSLRDAAPPGTEVIVGGRGAPGATGVGGVRIVRELAEFLRPVGVSATA